MSVRLLEAPGALDVLADGRDSRRGTPVNARRSMAAALSPIDRKLLRLLYMNLGSGDGWSEPGAAYQRYWETS